MSEGLVSLQWTIPPSTLANNTRAYGERLLATVYELAQVFAAKIETYAKQNAPWTDRSTIARQSLWGNAVKMATGVVITLSHGAGVFYGIYLEVKNAGRYAIIVKALEAHYGPLMSAIRAAIGGR